MKMQDPDPSEHPAHPMKLIGLIHRSFARVVDAPLRELGFAMGQLPVLVALKRRSGLLQADLARIAQVEQPSMAQLLARMERDGLVERSAHPEDGRSRPIRLTDAATRLMPKGKAVMDTASECALSGFSEKERLQLIALLERIYANLSEADGDAA